VSRETEDRLRSALQARTATMGEHTLTTQAPEYQPTLLAQRQPLLPRWAWVLAAVAVVASVVAGIVLGVHSSSVSKENAAKLPPPMTQDLDSARIQLAITSLSLRGKLVHLELSAKNVEPVDGNTWYPNTHFGKGPSDYDLSGIYLTAGDGTRLTPTPVSDTECLCTDTIGLSVKAQRSTTLSVSFNAPAKVPSKVDVNIPQLPQFEDVPISK
jgi:hypothetical protein